MLVNSSTRLQIRPYVLAQRAEEAIPSLSAPTGALTHIATPDMTRQQRK